MTLPSWAGACSAVRPVVRQPVSGLKSRTIPVIASRRRLSAAMAASSAVTSSGVRHVAMASFPVVEPPGTVTRIIFDLARSEADRRCGRSPASDRSRCKFAS